MKKKPQRLINAVMITSMIPLLFAVGVLISGATGHQMFSDLAFIIPMFLGTSIFFVGSYLEAKYEDTYGIDLYISNRKVKMRTAISGCTMSLVMAIVSLFVI